MKDKGASVLEDFIEQEASATLFDILSISIN